MAVEIEQATCEPKPTLRVFDGVAIITGLVIGVGIFKTPALVAANSGNSKMFMLAWVLGGLVSLIGALCYAELAAAYPHAGGDYHYFCRSFGSEIAFLFCWARMMVIQTGSIAMLAFVFGDYLTHLVSIGGNSSPIFAALAIVVLTGLNALGKRQGTLAQNVLTTTKVVGLLLVAVAGIALVAPPASAQSAGSNTSGAFGLAMVFVLLSYGGWNEAAYISAELCDVKRNMLRTLLWSIGLIAVIYLLINFAYLRGLGMAGISGADAVAADLLKNAVGAKGASIFSLLVVISVLGAANADTFTGARVGYAMGRNTRLFSFLGRWHTRANAPSNAVVVQGCVALLLVLMGALTRKGFSTMVEYTAPVFWFFFLLTGLSLFVLRTTDPDRLRPFRVPLYPLIPLLFCVTCIYMLYSSLAYTGIGALVGVAVLLTGIPVLLVSSRHSKVCQESEDRSI